MDIGDYNSYSLQPVLEKMSSENKFIYLMGDFNINLLKIDEDNDVTIFFDIIAFNLFIPFIINPTRVTLLNENYN